MSHQLGKLGTRHRGPFFPKDLRLPQATGGLEALCEVTGLVFVVDSYRVSFFVKANSWDRLCLFHANANGSDIPLAYSFSLLVAGTA
jgi:hypothetical protein